MVWLLILEGLGTTELLVILVVALILIGPRKLPQISRTMGKTLGDFKRASEDFKKTWEREVERERVEVQGLVGEAMLPPAEDRSTIASTVERSRALRDVSTPEPPRAETISPAAPAPEPETPAAEPLRKRDWL